MLTDNSFKSTSAFGSVLESIFLTKFSTSSCIALNLSGISV